MKGEESAFFSLVELRAVVSGLQAVASKGMSPPPPLPHLPLEQGELDLSSNPSVLERNQVFSHGKESQRKRKEEREKCIRKRIRKEMAGTEIII